MGETATPTVAPAMTADEWEWQFSERNVSVTARMREAVEAGAAGHRHALAALALFGQPFGFTRKDVEFLRAVASDYETPRGYGDVGETLLILAARIESLFPPEGTNA